MTKAGVLPYFVDAHDQLFFYFMTPSDPTYGGSCPQIAKGNIDAGEDTETAALREGHEELGLVERNISKIQSPITFFVNGTNADYELVVYPIEVISPVEFDVAGHETGSCDWLTVKQFRRLGREEHINIVAEVENALLALIAQLD